MARQGLGGHALAAAGARRDRAPVRSAGSCSCSRSTSSMRAFDIHALAGGRRARAAADERRDDLPALAGQHRPAPGRRRAAPRSVRRRVLDRLRVRARAAGDRDVGRRRRRADLPRPRGSLVRDAAGHARGERGGRWRRRARRIRPRGAVRALACPASLKGVLTAAEAAAALAEGLRSAGAEAVELPVADGGEGTAEVLWLARAAASGARPTSHDAFGRPRRARWLVLPDGTAVVEAAAAVPLDPARLDPLAASSRGFGELVLARARGRRAASSCSRSGGTATMDAGAGFLEVVDELPVPARVACDVTATLLEAPRLFGPQKGAGPTDDRRARAPVRGATGARVVSTQASNGRGGWARGGARVTGRRARLGRVATSSMRSGSTPRRSISSSPARVASTRRPRLERRPARSCAAASRDALRCLRRRRRARDVPGAETVALSGDPARARNDLVALGRDLVLKQH